MKILLDHCLPRRLKHSLSPHVVATAVEMGWNTLRNGNLLAAAAQQFEVFLTVDKNLKHQQNLATLPIAVVVIMATTNRFEEVVQFLPEVLETMKTVKAGSFLEVSKPGR